MPDIPEEEQCIAITQSGSRCSRIAKGDRFCFQHDSLDGTIEGAGSNPDGLLVVVSEHLSAAPEQLSGVQRDVTQNVNDIVAHAGGVGQALRSLEFADAIDGFRSTVTTTGPSAGTGALVGGAVGSPFGPIGIAVGATVGSWYGVYHSTKDGRAVAATVVGEGNIPEDAAINSSEHPAIVDLAPVQLAMKSALETKGGQPEWLRSTLTRERDMGAVSDALEELEAYDSTEEGHSYFIEHEEHGVILQVVFGKPSDNE